MQLHNMCVCTCSGKRVRARGESVHICGAVVRSFPERTKGTGTSGGDSGEFGAATILHNISSILCGAEFAVAAVVTAMWRRGNRRVRHNGC